MAGAEEYKIRIKGYQWSDLLELWHQILSRKTPDWDTGKALEYFILRAFELEGAEVVYPYSIYQGGEQIEQIDGVIYISGLACIVECKDYAPSAPISIEPIAKLRNQILRRPTGVMGSIFSTSGFTDSAITLAQFMLPQAILLWEGDDINYAVQSKLLCQSFLQKYRYCIEYGVPYYGISRGGIDLK
ncbi:restriction endonuclease [Pseudanabaena sp. PCC 6802]|uniref:restriction endonuclease n=1 Tax=Pseudanabaena sp. PCC 6802 TaxID=118173 RepID=UPI000347DF91|nr:restriction endonuclease [Pseudanabaena sp. PCC 6802]